MIIPFTLWINILNFKNLNIFTYDVDWYLKVEHAKSTWMYVPFLIYLLICILDLFVYIIKPYERTSLSL